MFEWIKDVVEIKKIQNQIKEEEKNKKTFATDLRKIHLENKIANILRKSGLLTEGE